MLSAKAAHPDDDFFKEERRRLHCPLFGCKRMYSDKDTLKSHVKDHQIHTQSLPGKTFRCSSTGCNRSFPSMQSLMEHGRHHYKPNTFFLCEGCRAKLASYNNLLKHLNNCSKVAKTKTVMPVGQTNTDMNLATAPDRVPGANLDGNANPMPDSVPITPPVTMGSPDSNHHQAPQQTDTAPPPLLSQMDGFLPDPPIGSFSKPDTLMQALQQTLPHLQPQNQTQQQALFQNQTQQQALFQNQTQQQALPQSQQQALPQLQPQNQNQQQALPQLQPQQQAMPQLQPQNQNQQQVLPQLQPLNQPQALPQLQPQNQQQALPQLQPQTQQQPLPQLQPHDQTQSPPPAQQQAEPEGLQEFPTPGSSPQPSPGSNAVWKNPDSVLEAEPNAPSSSPSSTPSPVPSSSPAPAHGPRPRKPRQKKPWIDTFEVPWNKMTPTLRQAIAMQQRAAQADRLQMVRIIVDAIRVHCLSPPRADCALICKKIIDQHPKTFADVTDEGEILGCGYTSLLNQIKCRSEHLNKGTRIARMKGKPVKSKVLSKGLVKPTTKVPKNQARRVNNGKTPAKAIRPKRKAEEEDSDAPNAKITRHHTGGYGCINWQPTDLPEGETEDSLKVKMETLVTLHKKTRLSAADRASIDDLMKKTYMKQRILINSSPPCTFSGIMEEWPFLFQKKYLCSHMETLTGIDVLSRLTEALQNKVGRVIAYFEKQKAKWKGEFRTRLHSLLTELEEESKMLRGQGLQDIRSTAAVLLLMSFFKETWESLFILADAKATKADVEAHLTIPDTPRLIMLGRSIMTASRWMLSIEGRVVLLLDSKDTFADAFAVLFASYYVFNMEYHEAAASTLELAQRFLVRINLEGGRKCRAKQAVSKRTGKLVQRKAVPMDLHVNRFIRSFIDFESEANSV